MLDRLGGWATELKSQLGTGQPNSEVYLTEVRTVKSLKKLATFFREVVREIVLEAPEIASLLLEGWNMHTELLVGHYQHSMSATVDQVAAKDKEIADMENRLEFVQSKVNDRVLQQQLRSEAHQLHELKMKLRSKDVEIAEQQEAHTRELENADAQLISALARLHDATNSQSAEYKEDGQE